MHTLLLLMSVAMMADKKTKKEEDFHGISSCNCMFEAAAALPDR
jgi:hypothetical protein